MGAANVKWIEKSEYFWQTIKIESLVLYSPWHSTINMKKKSIKTNKNPRLVLDLIEFCTRNNWMNVNISRPIFLFRCVLFHCIVFIFLLKLHSNNAQHEQKNSINFFENWVLMQLMRVAVRKKNFVDGNWNLKSKYRRNDGQDIDVIQWFWFSELFQTILMQCSNITDKYRCFRVSCDFSSIFHLHNTRMKSFYLWTNRK